MMPPGRKVTHECLGWRDKNIEDAPHMTTGQCRGPSIYAGCATGLGTRSKSASGHTQPVKDPIVKSVATTWASTNKAVPS